ncbi:MAG: DUF924 family protein, partial [Gammaproteobacteria bacterium]
MTPKDILDFWFAEENRRAWFQSTPRFDQTIRERFEDAWRQARDGELSHWEETPEGALALAIILDQFPLNMYRNQAASFSTEAKARDVSRRALEKGWDQDFTEEQKLFLYLPWMHSESLEDQERSVQLFTDAGMDTRFAHHHHDIVARFGRFPHRNIPLDRDNTP